MPGIIKRRADTTVELRDGQAFAIAGMLQAKSQRTVNSLPWLGSVPMIGALFSSKEFQQDETELVVIVSPHLVHPQPPSAKLKTPLDTSLAGNDIDFFLQNRAEIPKTPPVYVTASGAEQHVVGGLAPGDAPPPRTRSVGLGRRDENRFFSCGRGIWSGSVRVQQPIF